MFKKLKEWWKEFGKGEPRPETLSKKGTSKPKSKTAVSKKKSITRPVAKKTSSKKAAQRTKSTSTKKKSEVKEHKKDDHTLRIGIDFGTSHSKIVVGDETHGFYAIPSDGKKKKNYLFPTKLYRIGSVYSIEGSEEGDLEQDLKLRFLRMTHKCDNLHKIKDEREFKLAALYLGMLTRYAKDWITSNHATRYNCFDLKWEIIIGFPSVPTKNKKKKKSYSRVEKAFDTLGGVALCLSDDSGRLTLSKVAPALKRMKGEALPKSIDCSSTKWHTAYPEILAQLACVNNTDYQINGKQILVDIGAGTVDVIIFSNHLWKNEEKLSIYEAEVDFIGAHKLHENRKEKLKQSLSTYEFRGKEPFACSGGEPYTPSNYAIPKILSIRTVEEKLRDIDKKYFEIIQQFIMGIFKNAVKMLRGTQRSGKVRRKSFSLMLSGGGSNLKFYQQINNLAYGKTFNSKVSSESFPVPEDLNDISHTNAKKHFHRLSVAYGLAHGHMELYPVSVKVLEEKNLGLGRSRTARIRGNAKGKCRSCGDQAVVGSDFCYYCEG